MKAPKGFKYSPNGYTIMQVAEGDEMCEAAIKAAIDLKIVTKAAVTKAGKKKSGKKTDEETAAQKTDDAATGQDPETVEAAAKAAAESGDNATAD